MAIVLAMKSLIKSISTLRKINKPADYNFTPIISMGDSIPKVVHLTYHRKALPPEIQSNLDQLKITNPDWEFRLYDDADIEQYIQNHFPHLLKYYHKINPVYGAAKADFFRYLLIYNEGGVYLDIKSSATKPISEIIQPDDCFVLSYWPNQPGSPYEGAGISADVEDPLGEFEQWYIISVKGHPFLKAVIENVCHNITTYNPFIHHTARWGVFTVTGPIAYSLAITSVLDAHPHRLERSHYELGLIYSIFSKDQVPRHHGLFKKHYSFINAPVVIQPFYINLILKLILPVRNICVDIINKLRKKQTFKLKKEHIPTNHQ